MMVTFIRSAKKYYAIAIIPLIVVPFIFILSRPLAVLISGFISLNVGQIRTIINVVAGLISCLLLSFSTQKIEDETSRRPMFVFCSVFVVILTVALVVNSITIVK